MASGSLKMFTKFEESFLKLIFWTFNKLSLNSKNVLGISLFLFSVIWGVAAYFCFYPPYDYYGYGFEYGRVKLINLLLGRSALGWVYTVASVGCLIAGIVATYKAFHPEKNIDYEQYLYPISKNDSEKDTDIS
jgi:hypothetical protein